MKTFFQNASKVSLTSLIATITVLILLICLLMFGSFDSRVLHLIAKGFIAAALPFLILNPLFGFIYSFFIKGKWKILYIILHFIFLCTISLFSLIAFMFRYFVPFAP
ncbi:hypothetical protein [Peribacillus asahii]|uniref:hypothetical protein n=1 Tax=Peribacillus asahii TaxID=228899 RepID=UPI00207A7095|nr:hypothetical protein [Peribacillus asahii]USK70522.1 hypothetical protein LIS76_01370 [Peribacillus asahii]